jgi:hypothetical protein
VPSPHCRGERQNGKIGPRHRSDPLVRCNVHVADFSEGAQSIAVHYNLPWDRAATSSRDAWIRSSLLRLRRQKDGFNAITILCEQGEEAFLASEMPCADGENSLSLIEFCTQAGYGRQLGQTKSLN